MKTSFVLTLLVSMASLSSSHAAWQKAPHFDQRTVDIATSAISETKLVSSKSIGQAENILSEDPTQPSMLPVGASEAVIDFGRVHLIQYAGFLNDSSEGVLMVAGSLDKKLWTPLGQSMFSSSDSSASVFFGAFQAKFLKIELKLSKGGALRDLRVYGFDTDKNFEVKQNESGQGGISLNVANGIGGSRIICMHPTPEKGKGLDFNFPATDEKYRTIIYDLGEERSLNEFGSTHAPVPVRLEVFTFDQMPEKEDWKGQIVLDPKIFDSSTPVATAEDAKGLGIIKIKPEKPIKARYVAIRWEPDFGNAGGGPFGVSGMNISGGGFSPANYTGGGGGGGGGGGTGGGGNAGPNNPYGGAGGSPFSFGTGGYAGGGGRLPNGNATGNATGNANGNANGRNTGLNMSTTNLSGFGGTGNSNGTPVASP